MAKKPATKDNISFFIISQVLNGKFLWKGGQIKMIFALVGNQNCGKTTLFNALTGSNQHVGNFPGVTVNQKFGVLKKIKDFFIVDLPGTYSLRPYSKEEAITRDFLLNQKHFDNAT